MKRFGLAILGLCIACTKGAPPNDGPHVEDAATIDPSRPLLDAIAGAEDARATMAIPKEALQSRDLIVKRQVARALARIADQEATSLLFDRLLDDDREVVAWAGYGLGFGCKGREERTQRALAARMASLRSVSDAGPEEGEGRETPSPYYALPRAIAKCGGPLAEKIVAKGLVERGPFLEGSVLAMGDLAVKKKSLEESTEVTLLSLSEPKNGAPSDSVFYALSRIQPRDANRTQKSARDALSRKGWARGFAIKTLGKIGKAAVSDLEAIVSDASSFSPEEKIEAARGLANVGEEGKRAAAKLLASLLPSPDPFSALSLGGASFHLLQQLVAVVGAPSNETREVLTKVASFHPEGEPPESLKRRVEALRCSAAAHLAEGDTASPLLSACAPRESVAFQAAFLGALTKHSLVGDRRKQWADLASKSSVRIREQAIEAIDTHPEIRDDLANVLSAALRSESAGLVATAAESIHAHPERVSVEKVEAALTEASQKKWASDLFETRIALLQAGASISLPWAKAMAEAMCVDANITVRERAAAVLKGLHVPDPHCDAPKSGEVKVPVRLAGSAKMVLTTDAGELVIHLDSQLAPVTSARIAGLVKSGFFKGIVVHRVVPGFVAQFGDPGGDGYGGSGTSLRCETSPVPFLPLDVGMALAGRDTGSSQLFVTLSRTPHLDGEYTRIGHAEGDWSALIEGDVIREVQLRE